MIPIRSTSLALLATGCLLAAGPAPTAQESSAAPTTEVATPEALETPPEIGPVARRVLDRAVEAMGGREARDAIRSSRARSRLALGETVTTLRLLTMKPGRFLARQEIRGLGEMEVGCDGEVGWRKDPPDGLLTPLPPAEAADYARRWDLQALIRELDLRASSAHHLEDDRWEETPCSVLELVVDERPMRVYYAESDGLPRMIEISEGDRRRSIRRVVIEAWSEPGAAHPVRWVRALRIEQPRLDIEVDYEFVSFDDVSESTFIPPVGLSTETEDTE